MKYKTIVLKKKMDEGTEILEIDEDRLVNIVSPSKRLLEDPYIAVNRTCDSLDCKSIYLSSQNDWVIGKNNNGEIILVPLKKKVG